MENNEINNLLKEALKEHAEKNNITTEVLYDEAMGDDGKISIWKAVKSYWTPKNWFNYKGYVSREKYWKTILGSIMVTFGTVIGLLAIAALIASIMPTSLGLTYSLILICLFIPYGICNTLAFFALIMKRANCAGVKDVYVWGCYIIPVILGFLIPNLNSTMSTINYLLNTISFGAIIGIGVMQNKFLEYKKVSAISVLSKGDLIKSEEEFFKK